MCDGDMPSGDRVLMFILNGKEGREGSISKATNRDFSYSWRSVGDLFRNGNGAKTDMRTLWTSADAFFLRTLWSPRR